MSKYTAKQIAESDDLFDKQIHKVRKFYLSRNPDKMMMLEERKAVIKERNKGLSPEYDEVAMNFIKEAYPFNEETESFIRKKFDMPMPNESKEQ